jgi:hypothetical protein
MKPDDRPVILALLAVALAVFLLAAIDAMCGRTGSDCPAFVKDYQELISNVVVGVIGFGGVILTLMHSAKLALDASRDEAARARQQAGEQLATDRRATREAFLADLMQISFVLGKRLKGLQDPPPGISSVPMSSKPILNLYETLIGRLTFLTGGEMAEIVRAYASVQGKSGNGIGQ